MKPVRSALLFFISVVMLSACFNPPEFSNSPSIEYEGISFVRASTGEDCLIVSVSFKDGNGDVGFDGTNPEHIEPPYNDINFFTDKAGEKSPVASIYVKNFAGTTLRKAKKTPKQPKYFVLDPEPNSGPLLSLQDRSQGFPSLPPYVNPYTCAAYQESYLNQGDNPDTIYIFKDYKHLIKNTATIVDTLVVSASDPRNPEYFIAVSDYFYIQPNVGQNNMYIKFFIRESDGSYTEYDFAKEFCTTFHGRIPILTDDDRPLEGVINYGMTSSEFLNTFGTKTLRLEITIYDRALNVSNTVVTPDFRLEEI